MERTTPKEEVVVEPTIAEEVIATAPQEIQVHFVCGKAHFEAGRYAEAIKEFKAIIDTAPGNIEARIWIRKAKETLNKPKVEVTAEGETEAAEVITRKQCIWAKLGMVSYHPCTHSYNCLTCEFDQMMQDKMAAGEAPELDKIMERFKGVTFNGTSKRTTKGKSKNNYFYDGGKKSLQSA